MDAVLIATNAHAERIQLPAAAAAQHEALAAHIGGTVEHAYYHHQAVLHLHGDGQAEGLEPNYAAWALACAWRGIRLPYALCGPVIITGQYQDGWPTSLDNELVNQANLVAYTTRSNHGHSASQLLDEVRKVIV